MYGTRPNQDGQGLLGRLEQGFLVELRVHGYFLMLTLPRVYYTYHKGAVYNLTMCLNGTLSCVDFMGFEFF